MSTAPAPNPTDLLATALSTGLKLNISGTLPGETLLTALIGYATTVRVTMASTDPALMVRLDAVIVQQIEDLQAVWRGLWVKLGVVKAS